MFVKINLKDLYIYFFLRHIRIKYFCADEYFYLVTYGANKIPRIGIPRLHLAFAMNRMFKQRRVNESNVQEPAIRILSLSFVGGHEKQSCTLKTAQNIHKENERKLRKKYYWHVLILFMKKFNANFF